MAERSGRFAWYELLTTDVAAAGAFYRKAVGWAVIVLLSVVVQVLLGLFAIDAPALGILHGINGCLLLVFALLAARRADVPGAGPVRASRDPAGVNRSGVIRSTS